jgi:tetratricopeptide (TPR) repeat protein
MSIFRLFHYQPGSPPRWHGVASGRILLLRYVCGALLASFVLSAIAGKADATDAIEAGAEALAGERFHEAEALFLNVTREFDQGADASHRARGLSALLNLAAVRIELGDYRSAEELLTRAHGLSEIPGTPVSLKVASLQMRGSLDVTLARFESGAALCLRALEISESALGPTNRQTALSLQCLASAAIEFGAGLGVEPVEGFRRALAIFEADRNTRTLDRIRARNGLGMALGQTGQFSDGIQYIRQSMQECRSQSGPVSVCLAETLYLWACAYVVQQQPLEAIAELDRARSMVEESLGSNHPLLGQILIYTALALTMGHQYEQAVSVSATARTILTERFGGDHPSVAMAIYFHGLALLGMGRHAEADADLSRYVEIRQVVFGDRHARVRDALRNWAMVKRTIGQAEAARALEQRANEIP